MVRIPSEYQEVEYLESTGTQYIDTGVVPSITDVYSWSGEFRHIDNAVLFGCRTSGTYKNDNQLYLNRSKSDAASGSVYGIFLISNVAGPGVEKRNIVLAWDCPDIYTTEASEISIEGYITENFKPTQSIYLFGFNVLGTNNSSVGGGKLKFFKIDGRCNFIPCYRKSDNKPGMYDTVSGTFYTNSGTGEFLVGNNVYYDTTNLLESRRRILLTTPHLESPTPANPLTFKSNMSAKLKEGKVYFTPIQEGTGDPSPDNVRPITGWDGITVMKCGKNLIPDESKWNPGYINGSSGNIASPSSTLKEKYTADYISVKPNTTYWFSYDTYNPYNYGNWASIAVYDKDKNFLRRPGALKSVKFVTKENEYYVRVSMRTMEGIEYAQLELGSTSTDYEPYVEPTKITISFPQTIYGGYVDLVNGEVVEEWTKVDMDAFTWYTSWDTFTVQPSGKANNGVNGTVTKAICDIYPTGTNTSAVGVGKTDKIIRGRANYTHICIRDDDYTDATDFRAAVSGHSLVYDLKTPIHHAIDPQVIRPLKGINNIWSDANGNIEIKFWKH